jgi:hypothetical protein
MCTIKHFSLLCAGVVLAAAVNGIDAAEASSQGRPTTANPPAAAPATGAWKSLFDGKTLTGWKEVDFSGRGPVTVTNGEILLRTGYMTGITYTNTKSLLRMDYEIELEARRVDGSDFFCGLTFPVGTNVCSFVVGGWGGSLVGLSSLDGSDAANNETAKSMEFKQNQWYHLRVQVRPNRIRAWIDDERMVNVDTTERHISIRMEMDGCVPLGVATWSTTGGLRNLRMRALTDFDK